MLRKYIFRTFYFSFDVTCNYLVIIDVKGVFNFWKRELVSLLGYYCIFVVV